MLTALLTLPALGLIAWEDLRARTIHWWWLPLLAIGLLLQTIGAHGWEEQVQQATWNLAFLGLQLLGVFLLMAVRHRDPRILGRSIGIGDLLFFVVLAIGLSQVDFILFLLSGIALCLPAYFLLRWVFPKNERTVPLAGLLAIYLACWQCWKLTGWNSPFIALTEYLLPHG